MIESNLLARLALAVALSAGTLAAHAEQRVYLLAKLSIENTTFTEVVFFYDPEATTLDACEADIVRGHRGQWQYYGHYIRKFRGVATSVSYSCLTTDLAISEWFPHQRYSHIYLIDRRSEQTRIHPQANYAECLSQLHETQPTENRTYYCAKSNQEIGPPAPDA